MECRSFTGRPPRRGSPRADALRVDLDHGGVGRVREGAGRAEARLRLEGARLAAGQRLRLEVGDPGDLPDRDAPVRRAGDDGAAVAELDVLRGRLEEVPGE